MDHGRMDRYDQRSREGPPARRRRCIFTVRLFRSPPAEGGPCRLFLFGTKSVRRRSREENHGPRSRIVGRVGLQQTGDDLASHAHDF